MAHLKSKTQSTEIRGPLRQKIVIPRERERGTWGVGEGVECIEGKKQKHLRSADGSIRRFPIPRCNFGWSGEEAMVRLTREIPKVWEKGLSGVEIGPQQAILHWYCGRKAIVTGG